MSEARVACLTPGCTNTIQPATAKRTGGYCAPCAGKLARAEHEEYVRLNRREVDLYAGVIDPVDLLRIMHEPRRHDPLINLLPPPRTMEQLYTSLTADDATRAIGDAIEMLRQGKSDVARDMAKCLAAFTGHDLTPLQDALLECGELWPPIAFRGACPRVRALVIGMLGHDRVRTNHGLQALAWIGDDEVVHFLQKCRDQRPAWADELFIPPEDYARAAGWELVDRQRKDLHFENCFAIMPASHDGIATRVVALAVDSAEHCPCCGQSLAILLRLDLTDPLFTFFPTRGEVLEVLTCPLCTTFGTVYGGMDDKGYASWAPENKAPRLHSTTGFRIPWAAVPLQVTRRRPIHAADWLLPTTLTQIGGLPAWVQDFEYPRCCRCHDSMLFIAQIDNAQFPTHEGVYYAFLCPRCRLTATLYQQT